MLPTLQDGQNVLVNKTQNVHIGDIVVANSSEYGNIIKRVDQVNDNQIHLVSDNKNVEYSQINGVLYEKRNKYMGWFKWYLWCSYKILKNKDRKSAYTALSPSSPVLILITLSIG